MRTGDCTGFSPGDGLKRPRVVAAVLNYHGNGVVFAVFDFKLAGWKFWNNMAVKEVSRKKITHLFIGETKNG